MVVGSSPTVRDLFHQSSPEPACLLVIYESVGMPQEDHLKRKTPSPGQAILLVSCKRIHTAKLSVLRHTAKLSVLSKNGRFEHFEQFPGGLKMKSPNMQCLPNSPLLSTIWPVGHLNLWVIPTFPCGRQGGNAGAGGRQYCWGPGKEFTLRS